MVEGWRYRIAGEVFGPIDKESLAELIRDRKLLGDDTVALAGDSWISVDKAMQEYPELVAAVESLPDTLSMLLDSVTGDGTTGGTNDEAVPQLSDDLADLLESVQGDTTGGSSRRDSNAQEWSVRTFGAELGPFTFEEFVRMAQGGELVPEDEVRRGPNSNWEYAREVIGLFPERIASVTESSPDASVSASQPARARGGSATRKSSGEPSWFCEIDGKSVGPFSMLQLKEMAASGRVDQRTRVRETESSSWLRASTLVGLFDNIMQTRTIAGQAASHARHHVAPPVDRPTAAGVNADQNAANTGPAPPVSPDEVTRSGVENAKQDEVAAPVEPEMSAEEKRWAKFFSKVDDKEQQAAAKAAAAAKRAAESRTNGTQGKLPPAPGIPPHRPLTGTPESTATTGGNISPAPTPVTPSPPAASPQMATPASVPPKAAAAGFTPSPPSKSKSRGGPSFNLSGLLPEMSGEAVKKGLIGITVICLLAAGYFVIPLLRSKPGANHYEKILHIYKEAQRLRNSPAADWSELGMLATPVLDEALKDIGPAASSRAQLEHALLQCIDDGKSKNLTGTVGYLRRIVAAKDAATKDDWEFCDREMDKAARAFSQATR
ncbi:MAG: GYF domain-containing protein [Planctomycetaceae bacterium]